MRKSLQVGNGELTDEKVSRLYMNQYISPRAGEIYKEAASGEISSENAREWIGAMIHDGIKHILEEKKAISIVNEDNTQFTPTFQEMVGSMFVNDGKLGEEFWKEVFVSWREYIKRPSRLDDLYIKHMEILNGIPRSKISS